MKHATRIIPVLVSALIAAGCAPLTPRSYDTKLPITADAAAAEASEGWTDPPVTIDGDPMTILYSPELPPQNILSRQIRLELETGATVFDLVSVLANLGYSVIIEDRDAAEAQIIAPKYHGTLGGLFSTLERAADVWVTWESGALVVSSRARHVFTLPQERKLAMRMVVGLQQLGLAVWAPQPESSVSERLLASNSMPSAGGVDSGGGGGGGGGGGSFPTGSFGFDVTKGDPKSATSVIWDAGLLTLQVRPSEYRRAIVYLEKLLKNAAIVNLHVAMVTVTANQDVSRGIDWSKMQLAIGDGAPNLLEPLKGTRTGTDAGAGNATTGNTGAGQNGGASSDAVPYTGPGVLFNGGTLTGIGLSTAKKFSMVGFLDYLDKHGDTKLVQSVMLRTTAGNEVQLKSVTQIPYVSGVGIGSYGSTSNTAGNTLGQANTEKANDGVILNLMPTYDAASQAVMIDMALSIQSVIGFNELSAGNQLGTLTQPTTAERNFNDVIRVRPGQTVVVGGISYDQIVRKNNVPVFLPDAAAHSGVKVQRESMFIVIRPTITTLGTLADSSGFSAYAGTNASARGE